MVSPSTPIIITMEVTADNSTTKQVSDLTIKFQNTRTNETQTKTTTAKGKCLIDGQNFTSGMLTTDTIKAWIDDWASYDDNIDISNNDIRIG